MIFRIRDVFGTFNYFMSDLRRYKQLNSSTFYQYMNKN